MLGPSALARERGAAADDEHGADESRAANGSSSTASAIPTDISGAVPIRIDAREGPASRTASMNRILRGAGHERARDRERPQVGEVDRLLDDDDDRRDTARAAATPAIATAPAQGSAPRCSPCRTATVSAPNRAPASAPNSTAGTV